MNPLTWNAHLHDSKSLWTGFGLSLFISQPELYGSEIFKRIYETPPSNRGFLFKLKLDCSQIKVCAFF